MVPNGTVRRQSLYTRFRRRYRANTRFTGGVGLARGKQSRQRTASPGAGDVAPDGKRERILQAAFAAFMERGYSETSTLEIATRAKVSKRELYTLVGNKQDMLIASIAERAARMRWTAGEIPEPRDPETLIRVLESFGTRLLGEVSQPTVISVFRLAIAEANRAPEVALALESQGRQANRAPLAEILTHARAAGLVQGDVAAMAERFMALLWGDLMMRLLLRLGEPPEPSEIRRRAREAALALLKLHGVRVGS